ncbi:hypothetical protein PW5551_02375 [Petrotoga sp. 9PW.55.5.1]|uniref:extracellular matrix/biofilm biosynthesis regulator RemA family protein n=1 Tax=Petrotoga sp. 9PW.55.5.1 TaxID=1308979 RepID=UPI000DC5701B|nr:extracellular matrix/biofilm biosynthesis regulator RemA family protein [Petrotoga sp. 9PW.55.5.1]RAO99630.1 hypothetical protein PW5551_02375 [Petrotoga sp. 9PW.55.5.1]
MFISVGKGVFVPAERVHSVIPETFIQFGKIKKIYQGIDVISELENEGTVNSQNHIKGSLNLIDASYGKAVKSVIYMDSGQIILTPLEPKKIIEKIKKGRR